VLSARASGPAALVQSGHNGWLFDLDQPSAFHKALKAMLAAPPRAKEMAHRGAKVSEQYSVGALAGRVKDLYEQLIEEKHALRNHSR
jgi:glycosyltransferase involved in cell wall biosynthesis